MVFYPHYIGDFVRDTARLTDSQSMAYLRLIWAYYETEQPLDDDAEALAFRIGSNASDVSLILRHFFFLHEGKWHQAKCDEVITKWYAKSESARASANARWEEKRCNANALKKNANALQPVCESTANNANALQTDATHYSLLKEEPKTSRASGDALPPGFAEFWSAYPRKVGKGAAINAWKRKKVNGHLPKVLAAVAAQKRSVQWTRDGGQYIPYPTTWINEERWDDEVSSVTNTANTGINPRNVL